MSTTAAGIALHRVADRRAGPGATSRFGDYMYRVVTGTKHTARRARHLPAASASTRTPSRRWGVYARSVLAFSLISILFLYAASSGCRTQLLAVAWASPPVTDHVAWNTAVSFVTNTNWQAYSGESTMGHLVQMAGLAVQNFVSAAVGIAVAVALVRGFARRRTEQLGNFWVDLTRITLRILLPIAFVGAIVLIVGGVVQNFSGGTDVTTLTGGDAAHHRRPGGQPGGDQGARHQRRRLLQRQLRPPVREPDRVDELAARSSCSC